MNLYEILLRTHSGLRWIALILLLFAIINAAMKKSKGVYTPGDRKLNMFAMVSLHLQFVIGLVLYFVSPRVQVALANFGGAMKDKVLRFVSMEHVLMMLLAIVLITIGHSKSKKVAEAAAKHKKILVFYVIGLIIILAAIPWPFRFDYAHWF